MYLQQISITERERKEGGREGEEGGREREEREREGGREGGKEGGNTVRIQKQYMI